MFNYKPNPASNNKFEGFLLQQLRFTYFMMMDDDE